jgi:hypothetical protein
MLATRILSRDVLAPTQRPDFVDFLLLSPGPALLIYGLAETNAAGGFGSAKVIVPLLARIALLTAFVLHALSVLWLTQIGAGTSYVATSIDLFVFGAGMGFTMMPTFSGAMQSIRGDAVARASTALNIIQQTGIERSRDGGGTPPRRAAHGLGLRTVLEIERTFAEWE